MFDNREEAGRRLAEKVAALEPENALVLALPRGGVPVAVPVARALGAPLDLALVRKIAMPGNPELAAGAVVDGGAREVVFNAELLDHAGLVQADFTDAVAEKLAEIETRRSLYLAGCRPERIAGRTVIVVDDGMATGATARAVLQALRKRGPVEVWLAVPVGPQDLIWQMRGMTDRLIFLEAPRDFRAVGMYYRDFDQVSDEEVVQLLRQFRNGQDLEDGRPG
ncbi:putative phosphoribosyl transferase [Rhodovulum bhavnagarense]|uniref:Putative phosphoribosyl transferase n=1 Tax=Rhodovulum bhavnagarense TaxID=992286 RepID=A0A4R2RH60_9RHOB|nr:phosphoribosyltransferase family protein [Rhodovulum bhavnagarense]TCP62313.1 putative phosphoribosyl transferase [Rhodovulum bhavnagarense]